MINRILIPCIAMLLVSCAVLPPQMPLPTVVGGQELYVIDSGHTFPSFEISHMGFSTHRGRFNRTTGWVILDRSAHTGSMELRIDADSVDTGDPKLEQHLRANDFLAADTYPTIAFKSNKMRFNGDTLVGADGELNLRGVTRPVSLMVTSFRCGKRPITRQEVCGADVETRIKRSEFGISIYPSMIGEEVKLLIQIEATKP